MEEVTFAYLDLNPTLSAQAMADEHVRSALGPMVAFLANAFHLNRSKVTPPRGFTKRQYEHHPITEWLLEDYKQWDWGFMFAYGLANETEARFGENVPVKKALDYMSKPRPVGWMPNRAFNDPPILVPEEFNKRVQGAQACYRAWYRSLPGLSWTNRLPPIWVLDAAKVREAAFDLIEKADVAILEPGKHRPDDLSDAEWHAVVWAATEMVNNRPTPGLDE